MRNLSLATSFKAKSSIIPLVVAISMLAGATAIASDPVYKWKDASGQSHYSQQVPEGVKYETITTTSGSTTTTPDQAAAGDAGTTKAASGATPAQVARQRNCDIAQKNVAAFASAPALSMDVNGDGKPVTLTADQQTSQLNLAKQQVAVYCAK
jgi:hypothetical protein